MPHPKSRFPTELELEILMILWAHGALSAKQIRQHLKSNNDRKLAPSTVYTTLDIMVEKKQYLSQTKEGSVWIYQAIVDKKSTTSGILKDVFKRVYQGAHNTFLLNLLQEQPATLEELDELSELIKAEQAKAIAERNSKESEPEN